VIPLKASTRARLVAIAGPAVASTVAYRYLVSPRLQSWGATAEEVFRPMPGDELVSEATFHQTHAITIAAPPEDIWPWLIQMGYGRAGFYSYETIERAMGLTGIKNTDVILPQFQHLKLGEAVPFGPGAALPVVALQQNRHLCFATRDQQSSVTWAFGLYPLDSMRTRLVSRNRGAMPDWTLLNLARHPARWRTELPMKLFINLGGFVMVRKMLLGIKSRAERLRGERLAEEQALVLSSGCE
jgi:hypothetical protein